MKKYLTILISLMLVLIILLKSQELSLTKDSVFPKLISNKADLTYGEAIFEVNNPTLSTSKDALTFDFLKEKGSDINNYEIYINYSEPIRLRLPDTIKTIEKVCIDENTTKEFNCSYNEFTPNYKDDFQEGWKKIDNIPTGRFKIKLVSHWNAKLGEQKIDWIPSITLNGEKITQDKWAWFNSSWGKRREINVTGGLINLINFTVLLDIPYNESMMSNFSDIRVVNDSCSATSSTLLSYEFENDTINNHTFIWLRIPILSTSGNSVCLYFNNSIASSGEDKQGTWDKFYIGVYHFDDGNATNTYDSLGLYNLTSVNTPNKTTGKFGTGYNFTLSESDKFSADISPDTSDANMSVMMWLTIFAESGNRQAISKWSATEYPFNFLHRQDSHKFQFSVNLGNQADFASSVLNTWIFGGGTYNGSVIGLIINSSYSNTASSQGNQTNKVQMFVGGKSTAGESWNGMLDEVKLSSIERGFAWIQREYQNANFSKFTLGDIESSSTPDTNYPQVNITYPLNLNYSVNVSELNYTVSDDVGLSRCWYSNSSGAWNSTTISAGINFTELTSVEGWNNWTLYCNDTSNNINSSTVAFFKETLTDVSICRSLSIPNSYYTQIANITDNTITNDCIIISAQNITFDCQGNSINSITNYSGVYSNQYNSTIKNCKIYMGKDTVTNTNTVGIEFSLASYGNIFNNTAIGNNGRGIMIINSNDSNLTNNLAIGNTSRGILLTGSLNNILTNNTATSYVGYGLRLDTSSNNNTLKNNIVNGVAGGFWIDSSSNNTLINNFGNSTDAHAIYLKTSSNNNLLINNTAYGGTSGYGFYLTTSSNNNILTNNTAIGNSNWGMSIDSDNNTLSNNTAIGTTGLSLYDGDYNKIYNQIATGDIGIGFDNGASHNLIQDCLNITGTTNDVSFAYPPASNSVNNTFINCSYETENLVGASGSQLIRKWYYKAYVNDSYGNDVSDANISAYNITGGFEFSLKTNSSGWINLTIMTEYVNNGTKYFSSLYTINATNGTSINQHTFNASKNNLTDFFTFDIKMPEISYGEGTSVDYANLSQDSIYINTTWSEINFANITFNLFNSTWSNSTTYSTPTYLINFTETPDGDYWYYVNITDLSNNKNSTEIRNITLQKYLVITVNSPTASLGGVDINITADYYSDCNYSLYQDTPSSGWISRNVTMNSPNNLNFYNNTILPNGLYTLYFYCIDNLGNLNSTTTRQFPVSVPGQTQGGGGNYIDYTTVSFNLCNKTYPLKLNGYDDFDIYRVINELKGINETFIELEVLSYINNWQSTCSEKINRTLEPVFVCTKIYYYLLNNNTDINSLWNSLNYKVSMSLNLVDYYLKNYKNLCSDLGFSDRLPSLENDTLIKIKEIPIIDKTCNPTISGFFAESIPIPHISIGNPPCGFIDIFRWIIRIEETGSYSITGVRIWWLLMISLMVIGILLIKRKPKKKREVDYT